ncbi:MAG: S9 family peptidase, partial [Acidobacteria bacterium]|nr:S9 family peptidase [Acidobacteriota bacterium]
ADCGKPQWTFSMTTYALIDAPRLAATWVEDGRWRLALLDTVTLDWHPVSLPLDVVESLHATGDALYFIGGSPATAPAIARYDLRGGATEILRSSVTDAIEPAWISQPIAVSFTAATSALRATADKPPGSTSVPHLREHDRVAPPCSTPVPHDREHLRAAPSCSTPVPHDRVAPPSRTVFAFYYPPHNPSFAAPDGERPPLLVLSHGGPTASAETTLDPRVQFWTSRGFAVLDVNYSGSTGYGRAYRDRLRGTWGVVDVEDVVAGALAMVEQGRADRDRLAIRGGSAGGYTTLAALTFHDVFRAGASYYGISDIEVLARDTHKFESRYLDTLIGPYPEMRDVYIERSPIHFTDRLSSALILFQGLDDKVVPPNQSEMMADAVRRKGLPVEYIAFEGEQHGFRRADTIVRCLEAELAFYGRVFGFSPADAHSAPDS